MEKYFKDKVFFEELEIWDHLLSLRDQIFDLEDGYYFVEYIEQKMPLVFRYERFVKFDDLQIMDEILYEIPFPGPRLIIHLRDKRPYHVEIDSGYLIASEHTVDGEWAKRSYRDIVLEWERSKVVFPTPEQAARAIEKLTELLIIQAKKVA